MSDCILREYRPGDAGVLSRLWQHTFGDPPELAARFLALLPELGVGAVAEYNGIAVGAAYSIDALTLLDSEGGRGRCGYIYAVAVSPEHRHKGLGAGLSRMAAELSRRRGAELICTLPAEDSLYGWYGEILGLVCALRRSVSSAAAAPLYPVEKLSAESYFARRERLLAGKSRLCPGKPVADFAQSFYECFGGGLYACGDALCAAYIENGQALIKELVAPDTPPENIAASLAAFLGCRAARYWLPSPEGEPYIAAPAGSVPANCIWNLSFD